MTDLSRLSRLNVYLVYSEELENRRSTINSALALIKEICQQKNIEAKIHIITEPGKEYVNTHIAAFNARVNYDRFADNSIYNELIMPLNVCQISNFEKHRYIYKLILDNMKEVEAAEAAGGAEGSVMHLIMEDDIVVLKDYISNIEGLIGDLKTNDDWDILFMCLNVVDNPERFLDINKLCNIIISKACYIIKNRELCEKLYEATNTFKMNIKLSLSKFVKESNYKAFSYNKITFIEGSKLGLYPSAVNPNNYLFLNNNYIALKRLADKTSITEDDIKDAERIYKESLNIPSVDIQNLMGVIYLNYKDYKKAKDYMCAALSGLKKCKGYSIMKNNEILNNTINIYKYEKDMSNNEVIVAKSKYS
jgi:GR25 family glycosyltransferase involved in LPS biosynthesis